MPVEPVQLEHPSDLFAAVELVYEPGLFADKTQVPSRTDLVNRIKTVAGFDSLSAFAALFFLERTHMEELEKVGYPITSADFYRKQLGLENWEKLREALDARKAENPVYS